MTGGLSSAYCCAAAKFVANLCAKDSTHMHTQSAAMIDGRTRWQSSESSHRFARARALIHFGVVWITYMYFECCRCKFFMIFQRARNKTRDAAACAHAKRKCLTSAGERRATAQVVISAANRKQQAASTTLGPALRRFLFAVHHARQLRARATKIELPNFFAWLDYKHVHIVECARADALAAAVAAAVFGLTISAARCKGPLYLRRQVCRRCRCCARLMMMIFLCAVARRASPLPPPSAPLIWRQIKHKL